MGKIIDRIRVRQDCLRAEQLAREQDEAIERQAQALRQFFAAASEYIAKEQEAGPVIFSMPEAKH